MAVGAGNGNILTGDRVRRDTVYALYTQHY